jgi:hypothetical protein
VSKCEISRFVVLSAAGITPVSFTVPRKGDQFQEDIYPDSSAPAHIQYTASTRSLFWMACTLSSAGAGWLILPSLEALVVTTHATCFSALCISLRSVMHIKEQDALRPKHALSHLKTHLKSVQKKNKEESRQ